MPRRVALWTFDETSGVNAADSALQDGVAQDATLRDGGFFTSPPGAVELDGLNDYIEIAPDPGFDLDQGSVVITFTQFSPSPGNNPFGGSAAHTLFSRDSSGNDNGGHLTIYIQANGSLAVRHQTASGQEILNSSNTAGGLPDVRIAEQQETTIIYSWSPTGSQLVIDGVLVDENSEALVLGGNNEPIVIGASQAQSSNASTPDNLTGFFDGLIADAAIFDDVVPLDTVPCFTEGTRILTPNGEVAIETLSVGDLVCTLDNGVQPIRWIGSRRLSARMLAARPQLRPIRIRKGALGNVRDLLLSPQHRVLLSGWTAELCFGSDEVLTSAKSLVNDATIRPDDGAGVTYWHIMLDAHEVVFADGVPCESFYPGPVGLAAMSPEAREEILQILPETSAARPVADGAAAARTCLKLGEGAMLGRMLG